MRQQGRDLPAGQPEAPAQSTRFGRYRVLRQLGMGGMGMVYAVWDHDLEREVALKLLREPEDGGSDAFKREFRSIADIRHPNVIRLYDLVFEADWFFTMELVVGKEFTSYVGEVSDPSGARLRTALAQVADGLAALHQAGMVHADVKPANVLVTDAGRVVLLDFGLTRSIIDEPNDSGEIIAGTIAYIAPELVAGAAPTPASDWYSVGVMLYESLTGRQPFSGRPIEVLTAKQERSPAPARTIAAHVPRDLDELCSALLDRDPARRPDGPTLLARLGSRGLPATRARRTEPPPFVGRTFQLSTLDQALGMSATGRTAAVFVRGPSGVGKTALLSRFMARATSAGAVVLSGRCYERESIPYKGFDAAMEAFSRQLRRDRVDIAAALSPRDVHHLVRLFPVFAWMESLAPPGPRGIAIVTPAEQRRSAVAALRTLLAGAANRQPIAIVIDDLHWGDADGASLLLELVAPPAPPPVLYVLAYRSGEQTTSVALRMLIEPLSGTDDSPVAISNVDVDPLTHADATALARTLLVACAGAAHTEQADAIARESRGNPYFLAELARLVNERERRGVEAAGDAIDHLPTLHEAISDRIAELSADAQRVLRVIAVAGYPVEPAIAVKASRAEAAGGEPIEALLAANLIRIRQLRDRTAVEPYHDRIRESAAEIGARSLRDIHLAVAQVLESADEPDTERLAVHYLAAGADQPAAEYTVRAADRAATAFAFDRAAALYQLALRLTRPQAADRSAVEIKYAQALANAGHSYAAAHAFRAAAGQVAIARSTALDLNLRAADQLMRSGRVAEGIDAFREVLAQYSAGIPRRAWRAMLPIAFDRARLWLRGLSFTVRAPSDIAPEELARVDALAAASVQLGYVDPIRAIYLHNTHLLAALRAGEPFRAARALSNETAVLTSKGVAGAARAEQIICQLEALADSLSPDVEPGLPVSMSLMIDVARGLSAFNLGRWLAALPLLRRTVDAFANIHGANWELVTMRSHCVWTLWFSGQLPAYCAELERGLEEARERDDLFAATSLRMASNYRFLMNDDPEGALRELSAAIDGWNQPGFQLQHWWLVTKASHAYLYQGRAAEGWQQLVRSWRPFHRSLLGRVEFLRLFMRYLRGACAAAAAAAASGAERARFLREARRDLRSLRRERGLLAPSFAAAIAASIAASEGRADAAELYAHAGNELERVDMAAFAAAARRHASELRGTATGCAQDDLFRDQGVVNPARFSAALVPR